MDEGGDRLVQRCHCGTIAQLQKQISSVTKGKGRHACKFTNVQAFITLSKLTKLAKFAHQTD
ncbi:hypothetical protein GBA52_020489 [Prunus armeniaca]|nr:hypothetical protein GBA52_020489 [Prunus armeniaca]